MIGFVRLPVCVCRAIALCGCLNGSAPATQAA